MSLTIQYILSFRKRRKLGCVHALGNETSAAVPSFVVGCFDGDSRQCTSFKTRALKVQDAIKLAIPGLQVSINPEKVRHLKFLISADFLNWN